MPEPQGRKRSCKLSTTRPELCAPRTFQAACGARGEGADEAQMLCLSTLLLPALETGRQSHSLVLFPGKAGLDLAPT